MHAITRIFLWQNTLICVDHNIYIFCFVIQYVSNWIEIQAKMVTFHWHLPMSKMQMSCKRVGDLQLHKQPGGEKRKTDNKMINKHRKLKFDHVKRSHIQKNIQLYRKLSYICTKDDSGVKFQSILVFVMDLFFAFGSHFSFWLERKLEFITIIQSNY